MTLSGGGRRWLARAKQQTKNPHKIVCEIDFEKKSENLSTQRELCIIKIESAYLTTISYQPIGSDINVHSWASSYLWCTKRWIDILVLYRATRRRKNRK
jgi:hypothetical protein